MREERTTHESYGKINICRTQHSGNQRLFGSDVSHRHTISLKISEAELCRQLNYDYYFTKGNLIEIELSPVQFAEAISNMNTDGIPCTIRYFNGKYREQCPFTNKTETIRSEFNNKLDEINKTANKLSGEIVDKLRDKKTINKGDREEIIKLIESLSRDINSNLPYVAKQCDEQLNKAVVEAKGEIESYIAHKVNNLGLAAIREESSNLLELE